MFNPREAGKSFMHSLETTHLKAPVETSNICYGNYQTNSDN